MVATDAREIPGYPGYSVDSLGNVFSSKRTRHARRMAVTTDKDGYRRVVLSRGGTRAAFTVHALVLVAFVGPRPAGAQARHLDGNPANNSLDNLAWGTPQENQLDRRRHGTDPRGERHWGAKLTPSQVAAIRRERAEGETWVSIARRYSLSESQAHAVGSGRNWRHIPPGETG